MNDILTFKTHSMQKYSMYKESSIVDGYHQLMSLFFISLDFVTWDWIQIELKFHSKNIVSHNIQQCIYLEV